MKKKEKEPQKYGAAELDCNYSLVDITPKGAKECRKHHEKTAKRKKRRNKV